MTTAEQDVEVMCSSKVGVDLRLWRRSIEEGAQGIRIETFSDESIVVHREPSWPLDK